MVLVDAYGIINERSYSDETWHLFINHCSLGPTPQVPSQTTR